MKKNILVVDDDRVMLKFVSDLLTENGHNVVTAEDGLSALNKLDSFHPHIIFFDIIMPKISGDKLTRVIRSRPDIKDCYLVIVSAAVAEIDFKLKDTGADYYIAKGPIDKLTVQLNGLMAEIETQPQIPPNKAKVMQISGVYPRRDAVGLLNALKFHQAVIESMAVGVIMVDI